MTKKITLQTRLSTLMTGVVFAMFIASPVMVTVSPAPVSANVNCETRLLGIPPWFRGLTNTPAATADDCKIKSPAEVGGLSNYIWKIALNLIEMGLIAVGYLAVFYILYGGFMFITGGSVPGQIEKARKAILNAVIGLAISMGSVAIINLIFGVLG